MAEGQGFELEAFARRLSRAPKSRAQSRDLLICMAEGEGFEPPVRFPVQWFSRPPVSTAHASLRTGVLVVYQQGHLVLRSRGLSPSKFPATLLLHQGLH
jgi:hypothetical protein